MVEVDNVDIVRHLGGLNPDRHNSLIFLSFLEAFR